MIRNKLVFITLILVLLFGMSYSTAFFEFQPSSKEKTVNETTLRPQNPLLKVSNIQTYIEHGPITITSDFQLNNSGFPGNGTIDDPIRIEGLNITDTSGTLIYISGTTFYFCIKNNLLNCLSSAGTGIVLDNVIHGNISNNIIHDINGAGIFITGNSNNNIINKNFIYNAQNSISLSFAINNTIYNNTCYSNSEDGIRVDSSDNNTIAMNFIYDNTACGVWLWTSNNNTLIHNILYNNSFGLFFELSNNNTISNNKVYENKNAGISPYNSSLYNVITNNTVYNNAHSGITVSRYSHYCVISNNTIYNNNQSGIVNYESEYSQIINNTIFNNMWSGTHISSRSHHCLFSNNIVYGNKKYSGISVGNSTFVRITKNSIYNNIEKGIFVVIGANNTEIFANIIFDNIKQGIFIETDCNNNTIINNDLSSNNPSGLQTLDDGSANNFTSNHWSDWTGTGSYTIDGSAGNQDFSPLLNPYHITPPIITAPTYENITLVRKVLIRWNASSDTFGHSLTYSVLYSTNDGTSWTTFASGLTSTNYTLDTLLLADEPIIFKVQAIDSIGFIAKATTEETFLIENDQLSILIVLSPNGGETLNETVTIEWSASLDSLNHSITYAIYYSGDGGATWNLIVTDLTSTTYAWDTTTVSNGFSYLIKVVSTCSGGKVAEDLSDELFTIQNEIPTSTEPSSKSTSTTPSPIPGITGIELLIALLILMMGKNWKKRR
ncbi:MAG: right-handed parallel beta-helix repeat-containing protein [Promethearchaeota archaeon]